MSEKEQVMNDLNSMAKQYDIAIQENEVANQDLVEARARIQGLMDSLKVFTEQCKQLVEIQEEIFSPSGRNGCTFSSE
jgi:mevalonate kinase